MRDSLCERRKALVIALALAFSFLPCSSSLSIERDLRDSTYRSEARAGLSFEERVAAQRSIEEVYWRHRIWPESNAGSKPSLDEVMTESTLRAKVEDHLRQSNALELLWDRPITADQLQAEMDRMSRGSRRPEMLAELYAALGNDPVLIAECLARPNLASRLIRSWYARDERFHGELRRRAEQSIAEAGTIEDLSRSGGHAQEMRWMRSSEPAREASPEGSRNASTGISHDASPRASQRVSPGASGDAAEASPWDESLQPGEPPVVRLDAEDWGRLQRTLGAWPTVSTSSLQRPLTFEGPVFQLGGPVTATAMQDPLTFEGRPILQLGPIEETDDAYSLTAVLDAGEHHVTAVVVSWTKTSFDAWWRQASASISSDVALPALAYALARPSTTPCVNDSWKALPTGRNGHTAVWTGSEMIVWGGYGQAALNSGGRYDPSTDTWAGTSVGANVPSPRGSHTAVWTGSEMIVWGGGVYLNTGGRYVVSTDTWIATSTGANVPSGRTRHTSVWTGSEMIVWAGGGASGNVRTGARYNPETNSWVATSTGAGVPTIRQSQTAIWTGSEMIVWGGDNGSLYFASGGRYRPSTNTWAATSQGANLPAARLNHTAVWTGSVMIVWGASGSGGSFNSGGAYDPVGNTWSTTSTEPGVPAARSSHTAVWTGQKMIVWGGVGASTRLNDGGEYDPLTNGWTAVGSSPLSVRAGHTAIWTGSEMIVWGGIGVYFVDTNGFPYTQSESTGARYSPVSQTWVPMRPAEPPGGDLHTAVWTGSEMIVWGGRPDFFQTNTALQTGGRYDPSTNSWTPTSVEADTPSPRYEHTAVWTGTQMIVWGGHDSSSPAATGGRYDPMTDHWSPTNTIDAPSARYSHAAVWTGSSMIIWGGDIAGAPTGGRYDPSSDSWTPTSLAGAPQVRYQHTMVWTGARAIVWGGQYLNSVYFDDGALYDPSADSWSPTGTGPGHPTPRAGHAAVWTGNEMIVWGGSCGSGCIVGSTGGRYDPSLDSWKPTSTGTNVPSPESSRKAVSAVWTGNEMIIWGGWRTTGGRYNPAADFWLPTSTVGIPQIRGRHSAVATGSEMIVWGGAPNTGFKMLGEGGSYCYACAASTWYRDGDGYGDPAASADSCVQPPGYVATADDCNDASASSHPGGTEVCDGLDNDCDGTTDDAIPPSSPPVLQIESPDPDTARLSWGAVATADAYDVVRGSLDLLRSTGGNFTVATAVCLGNDLGGTTYDDSAAGGGQGFWYLVRAVNCGGPASYDEGAASQVGSRDAEIQASAAACP